MLFFSYLVFNVIWDKSEIKNSIKQMKQKSSINNQALHDNLDRS